MLDRLEREEAERDAMKDLEKKTLDAKTEMQIADALDEVRTRNAARERTDLGTIVEEEKRDEEAERQEREDAELARLAFQSGTGEKVIRLADEEPELKLEAPKPFARVVKKKKDLGAGLGIKKKALV